MARAVETARLPGTADWDMDKLQARLAATRRGRDINIVSREIGVRSSTLRGVEDGELPQIEELIRLCLWLDTTIEEFTR